MENNFICRCGHWFRNLIAALRSSEIVHHCGTLSYTRRGLAVLFVWLLWGDFCLIMFERVRPIIVPLMLKAHGASNLTIGLVCGSIPALLNFIISPIISTASDRTRSKYGRRIPYMLAALPFVSLTLIALGFSDQIGAWLAGWILAPDANPAFIIISVLVFFCVAYSFFDLFAGTIYYYIFADVVPSELTGRFIGFFRVVGYLGGMFFNLVVMRYIEAHMTLICVISALIYFFGFGGMCFAIKEGEYPPPPDNGSNLWENIKCYARECFTMPFWLIVFFGLSLNYASTTCRNMFNVLYAIKELNMTSGEYGVVTAVGFVVSVALSVPVGWLCDKFHPIRIYILGAWMVVLANVYGFFFCHSYVTFFITSILLAIVYVFQNNPFIPLTIALFPKQRYGQFNSAANMFKALAMVIANGIGGWFIDLLGYQYIFMWDLIITGISIIILHWIYMRWKQLGGEKNYIPPQVPEYSTAKAN